MIWMDDGNRPGVVLDITGRELLAILLVIVLAFCGS